jgi:hypothetical protein
MVVRPTVSTWIARTGGTEQSLISYPCGAAGSTEGLELLRRTREETPTDEGITLMNRPLRLLPLAAILATLLACQKDITSPPSVVPLTAGTPLTVGGAIGSERAFTIEVPEGTGTLRLRMTGGDGDADMLVQHGMRPTLDTYDCISTSIFSEEECIFDLPSSGTWYVVVYGYTAYSNVAIKGMLLTQSGATILTTGVAVTALAGATESFRMFSITVPAGTDTLRVALSATGDADLYLSPSVFPLLHLYQCASFTVAPVENCVVVSPQPGTWYIRVDAFAPYTDGTLTATLVDVPPP